MKVLWQSLHRDVSVLALVVGLGAVLMAVNTSVLKPRRQGQMCQSNLRHIGLALGQYTADYDSTFPLAPNWVEALGAYSSNPSAFHCPTRGNSNWGYAFNSRVAGMSERDLYASSDTVLIFESDAKGINAVDNGASLPKVPLHPTGHMMMFGDNRVKAVYTADFARGFDSVLAKEQRDRWRQRDAALMQEINASRKKVNTPKPTR